MAKQAAGASPVDAKTTKTAEPTEVKPIEPTVEQLKEYINQIMVEYNKVLEVNKQLNVENVIKRLNLLFKVLEMKNLFPREFVTACKEEIMVLMIIKEQDETSKEEQPKA